MTISFNQRASIAATIEGLKNDNDLPIEVCGLVYCGDKYEDMSGGEAERIVVDAVLDHEYVKAQLEENEALWEFAKWMVGRVYYPNRKGIVVPNEFKETLLSAVEARHVETAH